MPDFHSCKVNIGPSLLASDLSDLNGEARRVLAAGADSLHLDIMDGHFVPNITFGAPVIKKLRENIPKGEAFFDCHLMVSNPIQWVDDIADAGADQYTFHVEAAGTTSEVHSLIDKIKSRGMKTGIAIKPGTPVEEVMPYLMNVDMVLVMTVEPGFGGQKFMTNMMPKIVQIRSWAKSNKPFLDIQVDGGLSPATIDSAAKAGANMIVAGSAVFKAPCPSTVISLLRKSVLSYGHGKNLNEDAKNLNEDGKSLSGAEQTKKIVMVSGCYDLLHTGHIAFFKEAASYGCLHVRFQKLIFLRNFVFVRNFVPNKKN